MSFLSWGIKRKCIQLLPCHPPPPPVCQILSGEFSITFLNGKVPLMSETTSDWKGRFYTSSRKRGGKRRKRSKKGSVQWELFQLAKRGWHLEDLHAQPTEVRSCRSTQWAPLGARPCILFYSISSHCPITSLLPPAYRADIPSCGPGQCPFWMLWILLPPASLGTSFSIPGLLRNIKNCTYLRYATQCIDMCIHCEIITTIKLINIVISHSYSCLSFFLPSFFSFFFSFVFCLFICVVRTLRDLIQPKCLSLLNHKPISFYLFFPCSM